MSQQAQTSCPSWWHHFNAFAPTVGFGNDARWLVHEFTSRGGDGESYIVSWNTNNKGPSPLPTGSSWAILKVQLVRGDQRTLSAADFSKHPLFPTVFEHARFIDGDVQWRLVVGEYCDCLSLRHELGLRRKKLREQTDAAVEAPRRPIYTPKAAERILAQALAALLHLHRRNLIHGDVNPGTILATSRGLYKLAHFGGVPTALIGPGHFTPTLEYTAPELCAIGAAADDKVDVWGLGIALYEVLTLQLVSPHAERRGGEVDHNKRPWPPLSSAESVRVYPWLSEYDAGLLLAVDAMTRPDPKQRPSTHELARMPYVQSIVAAFAEEVQQAPLWIRTEETMADVSVTDDEKAQLQLPQHCVRQSEADAIVACLQADGLTIGSTSSVVQEDGGVLPAAAPVDPGVDENEEPVPVRGDAASKTRQGSAGGPASGHQQPRRRTPMSAAVLTEPVVPSCESQCAPNDTTADAYNTFVTLLDAASGQPGGAVTAAEFLDFEAVMRGVLEAECWGAWGLIIHMHRGLCPAAQSKPVPSSASAAEPIVNDRDSQGQGEEERTGDRQTTPQQRTTPDQRASPHGKTPYSPKLCQRTPSETSSDAGDSEADSSYSLANSTRGLLTAEEARLAASSSADLARSQTQGTGMGSSRGPSAANGRGRDGVTPTTGGAELRRKALERHVAAQRTTRRVVEVEEASERTALAEVLVEEWHDEVASRLVGRLEPAIRDSILHERHAALDSIAASTIACALARAMGMTEPPPAEGLDIAAAAELAHRAAAAFFCGQFVGAHCSACIDRERIERDAIAASWRRHCTECQCLADELAVSASFSAPGIDVDGLCGRVLREAPAPGVSKPPPPLSTDPDDELSPVRRQFVHAPPPLVFSDVKGAQHSPARCDGRPQRPPTAPASRTRPQEDADRTTAKLRSIRSAQTYLAPTPRRVANTSPPRSRVTASPSSTAEKDLAALHTLRTLIAAASPFAGEDGATHDGVEMEARPPLVPAPPTHEASSPARQRTGFAHTARPRSAKHQGTPYATAPAGGHGRSPRGFASTAPGPRPPSAKAKEASQRATVAAYARVLRNTSKVDGSPTKSTESSVAAVLGTMRPVHVRSSEEIAEEMRRRERKARKARRKAKRDADAAMKATAADEADPVAEMYIGGDDDADDDNAGCNNRSM